jgi:adenosylcobinamide-phosphate synthase
MGTPPLVQSEAAALAGALLVDWTMGEPPAAFHPVVWMGTIVRTAERRLGRRGPAVELLAGAVLALAVPCAFAAAAGCLLHAFGRSPVLTLLAGVWLLKSVIAVRALGAAAVKVRDALGRGNLAGARANLGSLCSRNAADLDEPALVGGAIESLAENTSDSVIAPLFYLVAFGVPGALFYRAANTLDAMIDYHGRYEYLGKAAARLDDLLNLIPAGLTAVLLLAAGQLLGHDAGRAAKVLRRDGGTTESPNAGRPMAAMAGLLGVELTKEGHYRLGDPLEAVVPAKIDSAWRVVVTASSAAAVAAMAILWWRR